MPELFQHIHVPDDYAAFQCDVALEKRRYGQLSEYRFLENTSHFDEDDQMMYKITKVEWWEQTRGEMYIVAHRIQCKYQHGYCVATPQEDFISIEEAMQYTGFKKDASTTAAAMDGTMMTAEPRPATQKRKRNAENDVTLHTPQSSRESSSVQQDEDVAERVHCHCQKRNSGGYCLAKLSQASPSAKRHPNAKYWACAKKTNSRCNFRVLAGPGNIVQAEPTPPGVQQQSDSRIVLDATNIVCSRCKVKGHFARQCTVPRSSQT